ncbi:MAG: anthranilate synthase component I family protein [bacterium]|nr:anthranilate synthase component I family protein [bacterium]
MNSSAIHNPGYPQSGCAINPSLDEFLGLADSGCNLIPLLTRVKLKREITPASVFEGMAEEPYSFWLDSGKGNESLARYSFLGTNPWLVFKSKGDRIETSRPEHASPSITRGNPVRELARILNQNKAPRLSGYPLFCGGAVGYLSYDLAHFFEELPRRSVDDLNLPETYFIFVNDIIGFDHLKEEFIILSNTRIGENPVEDYRQAKEKIADIKAGLEKTAELSPPYSGVTRLDRSSLSASLSLESNFTRQGFEEIVKQAKSYIKAGDIFQVNLSQRLSTVINVHPFTIYKTLRSINPAPFACYLSFGDLKLVGSSPERLLRVDGRTIETRPIAGTRPRGKTIRQDSKLRKELILDAKERAEHIMLVDLERNDLGRICKYGSVHVDELMVTEEYSHVIHIVSNVVGRLREKVGLYDILRATFPGGTITGTPKIRAMEIIDELEPVQRGPYTGSAGYISCTGDLDLNIIIRTIVVKGNQAYAQAGAGIVADSDPNREYYETLHKAEALIKALKVGV